jgi:hypothetical protein
VPFLGWGLWAMGMPLVSRKWMKDRKELDKVFKGVVERKWPICRFHLFTLHAPHSASIYLLHFTLSPTSYQRPIPNNHPSQTLPSHTNPSTLPPNPSNFSTTH